MVKLMIYLISVVCGIWKHGKYFYGMWQRFASISGHLRKWSNAEKCKQSSPAPGFGPKQYVFLLPAKALPSCSCWLFKTKIVLTVIDRQTTEAMLSHELFLIVPQSELRDDWEVTKGRAEAMRRNKGRVRNNKGRLADGSGQYWTVSGQ